MRAAIYVRVSTDEQVKRSSNPQQLEACTRHIEAQGWTTAEVFIEEAESAFKDNPFDRTQFQAFLGRLDEFDCVVFQEQDRIARLEENWFTLRRILDEAGVKPVSVLETMGDSADERLQEGIRAVIAAHESRKTRARVKRNMDFVAKTGRLPTKAPIGYINFRAESTGGRGEAQVIVDEQMAPLVVEAFELYAMGDCSLSELCAVLNQKGLRNTRGNPIQPESLRRTFRNPFYYGWVKWGDVEGPGDHEPIVSRTLWDEVQDRLDARNRRGSSGWVHDHYLKSLLVCSCGRRMAYQVSKGHGYFYCLNRSCREPYARADALEEEVAALYADITFPEDLRAQVEQGLEEEIARREEHRAGTLDRLSNHLSSLARQREKLLKLYYADALDVETFKQERKRIDLETSAAEGELRQANAALEEQREVIGLAMKLLEVIGDSYQRVSEDTRRKFNLAFFEHIIVSGKSVTEAKLAEPFRSVQSVPTTGIRWS